MSEDTKFYRFETDSSVIGGDESRGKCTRERLIWAVLVLALIGALVGVLVHFIPRDKDNQNTISNLKAQIGSQSNITSTQTRAQTTSSPHTGDMNRRINCIPEAEGSAVKATAELCERRGCVHDNTGVKDVPICYHGNDRSYRVVDYQETPLGFQFVLESKARGPFGQDISSAIFDVEMWSENIIRFKFDDPEFRRYTVPLDIKAPSTKSNKTAYSVKFTNNETFAFQIIRTSTGKVLWDTSVGGLVLSDQFLQISTKLPSSHVYGFGENTHRRLKHDLNFKTWPMFARGGKTGDMSDSNLYGVHPFYTSLEGDGNSHGVFLLNSNAMDYSFTPLPMLTYRTIGGILDFYMFLGPEPENVIQQYTGLIGRPYMPPYWSLGFQLSRYGYRDLQHLKESVQRTKDHQIPHDVQYIDIDYMKNYLDFTVNDEAFQGLPEYFTILREEGMRTVVITDPYFPINESGYEPYDRLRAVEGAVKWPEDYSVPEGDKDSTNAMLGYGRPKGKVVYPDFFNNGTKTVWADMITKHRQEIPFDGLWIDMNEPDNFGTNMEKPWNWPESAKPYWSLHCPTNNRYESPPYRTKAGYRFDTVDRKGRLSDKTLCMVGRQGNNGEYRHYDVHSLYGWSQAPPTMVGVQQATGERGFVLSRSTYPGSGSYTSHWLGDNKSDWPNLKASIIGMLEFNMFGIPHVGADICGYAGNATAELCKRWMQLGAFYPFSRQHNRKGDMDNDPGFYGEEVGTPAREAMETRYWLLPYLYTLFHKAHTEGSTVAHPIFHEFPADAATYGIDSQFMWGQSLMIVPVLEENAREVSFYKPAGVWYNFYSGSKNTDDSSATLFLDANSKIPVFVRGGSILPLQSPANNTAFSRQNPMKLLVALNENHTAEGELFWDDGVSKDTYETGNYFYSKFSADEFSLTMKIEHNHYEVPYLYFNEIQIYGVHSGIKRVIYDGQSLTFNLAIDNAKKDPKSVLTVTNISIPLNKDFTIYFSPKNVDETRLLDCFPEAQGAVEKVTKATCEARGCIYNKAAFGPSCHFILTNYGYRVVGEKEETQLGFRYKLEHKGTPNPYSFTGSKDVKNLLFTVEMRGNDMVRIKLEDADNERYEVPIKLTLPSRKAVEPRYEVKVISNDPFSFKVIRKSNDEVIWDTGVGGLTFSDQFLQISTKLPSNYIYGFGENVHHSFKHDLKFRTWPMWSRDQPVSWGENLNHYGVHPFYTCMENGGHSHGVLLLNSNAQDYSFTPLPMLTYRTIGGILDFYMFLGPEPENVIQQYTGMIGRPYMPPYWSLGFQLCRYGYNSLKNLEDAAERTIAAKIPFDIQYADIDHMDERKDFTIDPVHFAGLNDYFQKLKAGGMHTIIILDPALISNVSNYLPYERMRDTNSNIKWPSTNAQIPPGSSTANNDLLGYVWPKGKTVFPDFFKNGTKDVWKELIRNHHNNELVFDGLWIDMNEPANFGTNADKPFNWPEKDKPYWALNCTLAGNTIEHPPYRTKASYAHDGYGRKAMISDKTVCMRAVQGEGGKYRHYDVHSLYGWSQTPPTLEGLREATGERGIVISRSTFPGSGHYSGHWLGDNESKWEEMRLSIIGILEFNLFGIPYIGADICGFFGDTTPELCKRWMQLGAFYTFSRNHNTIGVMDQDPAYLGHEVAEASRVAMETRYQLLPYLYTLFHYANVKGNTVIRPLHHVFPYDVTTYQVDKQFMWGAALLISPILHEGQTSLSFYLPKGPWYYFYTGQEMSVQGSYKTISVGPDSRIPLHVRAGHILPLQASANNTHYSRQKPFTLMVALEDSDNGGRGFRARGELFWDDGVTIDAYEKGLYYYATFRSDHDTLSMNVEYNNETSINNLHVEAITLMGVRTNVKHVYIGENKHTNISYNTEMKVLTVGGLNLPMTADFTLEWREFERPSSSELNRFDCYPDIDDRNDTTAQLECERRGCIYSPEPNKPYLPKCYIDRNNHKYTVHGTPSQDSWLLQKAGSKSLFGSDINNLKVTVEKRTDQMLRVKITDATKARYEVPVHLNLPDQSYNSTSSLYDVEVAQTNQDFHIKVTRKSTKTVIFDTSVGPLIFSDQYIQISSALASDNFYGLGEHRHFHLKHNMDYKTWPIFTRDAAVNSPDYSNLYGAHPFYLNMEDDQGNAHAVLLLNSNAMEVLLEPQPRVTFRTIGGILDFYIFMGPEPETVIQQYTQMTGPPVMVPYWSLGFQLCRWGYNSLDNMKAAVDRTKTAGIPHDVQSGDIDYMDERKDFTYDTVAFDGFPEYVKELQAGGMHFIVILDPGIISNETNYAPYDEGVAKDVFIRWPAGKGEEASKTPENYMLGYVWPKGKVTFPDFLKENITQDYWIDQITDFHNTINFDGLWIDMNEPANFDTNGIKPWTWPDKDKPYWSLKCNKDGNNWDNPPYKPRSVIGDLLSEKTLCMNGVQNDGKYRHYDVHSLYGWSETKPTMLGVHQATGKRGLVLSRSTYPTSGRTGTHWLGDNDSFWSNLHDSIIGIIEFNLFGIPYIGADICGFSSEAEEEMCQRWMQLGAFYTFSRNHNARGTTDQDPGMFGKHVGDSSRQVLETRYRLLPYLYTQFYRVHAEGGTIIRSMMHEFPTDKRTWSIDTQFMWAGGLLIAPVLEAGHFEKEVYLPNAKWFDYYTGRELLASKQMVKVDAPRDYLPLFVRGGYIIPTQDPANNTHFSRQNPMKLLVALDVNNTAQGDLFWDDGDSIDTYESGNYFYAKFSADEYSVSMTIEHDGFDTSSLHINEIKIYGAPVGVKRVIYDGNHATFDVEEDKAPDSQTRVLRISDISIPLDQPFTVYMSTDDFDETSLHDCFPEAMGGVEVVTKATCEARGCIYNKAAFGPVCHYNLTNYGYRVAGDKTSTKFGFDYKLEHKGYPNPYSATGSKDIPLVLFSVEMRGNDVLRIKLTDADKARYEVPTLLHLASDPAINPRYEVKVTSQDPFSFQVIRVSNGEILWDTGVGGLTFSDQFLQISTKLPSNYIYGFGENVHHSFKHDLKFRTWPMWSRDQATGWGPNKNHYGVHPFYTCMEKGGHSHGVLLLNSNAQDYSFTPLPMLTYRTIGGVLDFYMFLGPEPENVIQQYTSMIGRPYMPPYWSLGFQLCRYGYNSLKNLEAAAERTIAAKIPFDIQYADIDHMDERKDFTIDPLNFAGLNDYFKELKAGGMRTIIILDPALITNNSNYHPYERMKDTNSNIKWPNTTDAHIPPDSGTDNNDLLGYVWPKGKVVFPDFFRNSTKQVWKELITNHHKILVFDGLWIDMNEPANFGTNEEKPFNWPLKDKPYWALNCTLAGNTIEHPPYRTMAAYTHDGGGRTAMISDKTVCMRAVQGEGGKYRHYDVHSLYGWSQTPPTLEGLREATGERGIVISRSTFPGSGHYSGHWLGDNDSTWEELRLSIIGILEFNLFGIPYIGADICGFFGDTTPELCKRWMQLGAFYTFSRNHNTLGATDQDPGYLGHEVAEASRIAMETRYQLLPYLYTLFHHANTRGNTVIRPLHHVFPYDEATYRIDQQFMWGAALLISPILYEGQTSLTMYLPHGPWYDFYTGEEMSVQEGHHTVPVNADSKIPLHVRAGHILPMQAYANNTHYSRMNPFSLLVALEDSENGGRGFRASGELFWDDGITINAYEQGRYYYATFKSGHDTLSMNVEYSNETTINNLHIEAITLMGVRTNVKHVYIGETKHSNISYNQEMKVLKVEGLSLAMNTDFSLEWREYERPAESDLEHFDCYPDIDDKDDAAAKPECEKRGCIYSPQSNKPYLPKCYIDRTKHGYTVQSKTETSADLTRKGTGVIFNPDIKNLKVDIQKSSNNILRIKISDKDSQRYEVPVHLNLPDNTYDATSALYDVTMTDVNGDFHVTVKRKSTNTTIFDTSVGPLIFSDQYIQISSALASDNFYGLGEHRHFHLKHNMDYKTWPIFTRDAAVNSPDYSNLYGAHPFYMNLEDDQGNAHAVLLLNSNAMEVLLEPQPRVTFRTIGGILDFYIFMGPEPETVIKQYTQVIGHPVMVPYWSLGFQLSRWGYNSLDNMKTAVDRTREANIPHDVQFADIDALDERRDFTVGFPGLPEYVEELQAGGMHFIVIVDPGIISNNTNYDPYDSGVQRDVFIKWPVGAGDDLSKTKENFMLGYLWPKGKVTFPDFLKLNATQDYWVDTIVKYQKQLTFDGLWIDMNEPSNFDTNGLKPWNWPDKDKPYWSLKCNKDGNKWDNPPYKPRSVTGDLLSEKTLCMNGVQNDGKYRHYDVHSLYGMSEAQPTLLGIQQATGKRGLVLSRSTYPTTGRSATHWLGDNDSFWRNLHDSIIGIIEFNLFGFPYIGADICGFFSEPSEEMCQRWMQLGAFYTFSRNHNGLGMKEQDPGVFGKHIGYSSRQAFEIRYSLLPYLYTQFYRVHKNGGTIIRSMMHEFPTDKRTWDVDTQFMWAGALLIAPVLEQGHIEKEVYFPDARWFDYHTGKEIDARKTLLRVDAPRDHIPLFLRGGHILPTQQPANNTVYSRRNPMELLVIPDDQGNAVGDLFWDDGESIDTIENGEYFYCKFSLNQTSVSMSIQKGHNTVSELKLGSIVLYGMPLQPSQVLLNGKPTTGTSMQYLKDSKVLWIQGLNIPIATDFKISWL